MLSLTSRGGSVVTRTILLATGGLVAIIGGAATGPWGTHTIRGQAVTVGAGTAELFVDFGADGAPEVLGIMLSEGALRGLPAQMNTTSRCHDKDGNGRNTHGECLGDYQVELALPPEAAGLGLPVTWATVNWNPEGHPQPAPPVWSAPHFDFHFFMTSQDVVNAIRSGPCGEFIHCDDFQTATLPLPDGFIRKGISTWARPYPPWVTIS